MAARRRRGGQVGLLQFGTEREATAWAILAGGVAGDFDNTEDAMEAADELLEGWRDRHQVLDEEQEDADPPLVRDNPRSRE